jgi:hypothetical protein
MVQAHARELLNQKESENDTNMPAQPQIQPQSPLFAATERLGLALGRLEKNLQHVTVGQLTNGKQREQLTFFEKENETLREDREQLNSALAQLQHQYDDLHKIASKVYGKLDDSIKRLTKIIEN